MVASYCSKPIQSRGNWGTIPPDVHYCNHKGQLPSGNLSSICTVEVVLLSNGWSGILALHRQVYSSQTWPGCIPAPEAGSLFQKYTGPDGEPTQQSKSKGIQAKGWYPGVWPLFPAFTLPFAVMNNWIKCRNSAKGHPKPVQHSKDMTLPVS